jgi:integrase
MGRTGGLWLTDPALKGLPPAKPGARYEIADLGCPGLHIRVDERGRKTFSVKRTLGGADRGKRVRVTLRPAYPALKLAAARAQAIKLLADMGSGVDPIARDRAAARAAMREVERSRENAFDKQFALFDELRLAQLRPASRKEVERPFRLFFLPKWRERDVGTIKRADAADVLDEIQKSRGIVPRNRAQAALSTFMNWLLDRGRIEVNPIAGLKRAAGEAPRDRVLTDDEIRALWWATDLARPNAKNTEGAPPAPHPVLSPLLRVLLTTGQRWSEVAGMRWDEIEGLDGDEPIWRIPAARYKTNRAHVLPLSKAAASIVSARPRIAAVDRVGDEERLVDPHFVFTTRGDAAYSGENKTKAAVDAAMLFALRQWAEQRGEDPERVELPRWVIHDLRRTARTLMQRAGIAHDVGEAVLGHVVAGGGVAAVYSRHAFKTEKRAALEKLAELVAAIAAPPAGNVTSLAARRAARAS